MQANKNVFSIGVDRCANLANAARNRNNQVTLSDNLNLPFRDSSFDACLSVAVIHHFGTTERRVSALRELARILRIGGKLMITVWAMEQKHRKVRLKSTFLYTVDLFKYDSLFQFESQDVLVPWHRPDISSSDDKTSSIDRDPNSTTTDEEDVMHYHACPQTEDTSVPSSTG